MPYATINGFRMFYDVRGEGDVIVFVHGGFPSIDMHLRADASGAWGWEIDFASEFRYVMYDRRGCWLSSRPDSGYDLENQVRDLVALLDHLSEEKAHVIGSSAGGPIAILFAARFPERVRTLALAGTAAHLWPDDDPVTRLVRGQLEILDREGAGAAWNNRPEGVELSLDVLWERDEMEERGTLADYEERVEELAARSSVQERVEWYGIQLRAIDAYLERDLADECRRIKAPTLVVHGARDREVPVEWGEDLASKIPGAEFRVYPEEPHSVVHGNERVRLDLMAFFRKAG